MDYSCFHDVEIKKINHCIDKPNVILELGTGENIVFNGVLIFRSESYFSNKVVSKRKLEIVEFKVIKDSWLIKEALSQFKPNNEKKWGDNDIKLFGLGRDIEPVHINIYCNDLEFDIVCRDFYIEKTK